MGGRSPQHALTVLAEDQGWLLRAVQRLTVLPSFERRGIGTQLLKAGLKRLAYRDPDIPMVVSSSQKGEKLYERCGFVKLGETRYTSEYLGHDTIDYSGTFMVFRPQTRFL